MEKTTQAEQIRELDERELALVSGGINLGAGTGGLFSVNNFLAASRVAGGAGLLYQSFKIGWDIGSYGYNAYTSYRTSSR